jgi:hypothetical protein
MPDEDRLRIVLFAHGLSEKGCVVPEIKGTSAYATEPTRVIIQRDIDAGMIVEEETRKFAPG